MVDYMQKIEDDVAKKYDKRQAKAELKRTLKHKNVEIEKEPTEEDLLIASINKEANKNELIKARAEMKECQAKLLFKRKYNSNDNDPASGVDL